MNEPDDLKLFEGLALEEPSPDVDRQVLTRARLHLQRARRRRRRGIVLALTGLATAAAVVVALGIAWLEEPGTTRQLTAGPAAASGGNLPGSRSVGSWLVEVQTAVDELRAEIRQIDEMKQLIPSELRDRREELDSRVRVFFADLEKIQQELDRQSRSSPDKPDRKKEINT